jgi:hypothetical protein
VQRVHSQFGIRPSARVPHLSIQFNDIECHSCWNLVFAYVMLLAL